MKTSLLIALSLFCIALTCAAQAGPTTNAPAVTLAWDQVSDPSVNGYRLYWGVQSRNYTNSVAVTPRSNTTVTVSNLVRGATYYFAATSTATNGLESVYSAEVSYTTLVMPPAPINPRVTVLSP